MRGEGFGVLGLELDDCRVSGFFFVFRRGGKAQSHLDYEITLNYSNSSPKQALGCI